MSGLVTLGETMLVLRSTEPSPLRWGKPYAAAMAGCESTVAIGVSRLGHDAAWLGRVGDDEAGLAILTTLRGEGVDVGGAIIEGGGYTGMMVRTTRTTGLNQVRYYRSGSAGSHLSLDDIAPDALSGRQFLHASGITAALSDSAREATAHAVRLAVSNGVQVSFDINHRNRLTTVRSAAAFLAGIIDHVDVLFCGDDELAVLQLAVPGNDPVRSAIDAGVREVVLKRGEFGAQVHTVDGTVEQGAQRVTVADTIGAGDAFAAGYLSGCLDGEELTSRLARAAAVAAFCVSTCGDWEGLPTRAELASVNPAAVTTAR